MELLAEACAAEEYRFLDPLASVPDAPSAGDTVEASRLPDNSRVTVIEADPGAGKTTTLQILAWRHADKLLSGGNSGCHIPVYLKLKLLAQRNTHWKGTIEGAVQHELTCPDCTIREVPWDSILLLVDGLNEVTPQAQANFKIELKDLLAKNPKLHAVITGRPNSFHDEFSARIVVLRRLTNEQLRTLFRHALKDEREADELLAAVMQSPFLSSWSRTPLHGAMIASVATQHSIAALADHATAVRRFVRGYLNREAVQSPGQTLMLTKERLLAYLAFETKVSGQVSFSPSVALQTLASAKAKIPALNVKLPEFIEESKDNHIIEQSENDSLEFAHELYQDYFAATELVARDGLKKGLGAEFALAHFQDASWSQCIRLFAGLTKSSIDLIERGAEMNPLLAWILLRDATLENTPLNGTVALAAYSVFEGDLGQQGKATLAAACLPVLADLGRADLIEQAIFRQRQILEPSGLWNLEDDARRTEEKRIQEAMVPLGYGLISILRLGSFEQRISQEARYFQASRAALRAIKQIKAEDFESL